MTWETERPVGLTLREARRAHGKTLVQCAAESGVCKSTISAIELTPFGCELSPSAEAYAETLGFQLVRKFDYELRLLPEGERFRGGRADSSSRASVTHAAIRSNSFTGLLRLSADGKDSSRSAMASAASSRLARGRRRRTSNKRRDRGSGK